MQHVVEAVQVGVDDLVPVFGRQRRKCAVAGDAGIAHHAVVRAVRLDIGLQCAACGIPVGHIERQHAGLPAQCLDFVHHCLRLVHAAAAVHGYIEPIARDAQRDGPADAPAGAGDQHAPIPCHACPLSR